MRVVANADSLWENGRCERHGGLLKDVIDKLSDESVIDDPEELDCVGGGRLSQESPASSRRILTSSTCLRNQPTSIGGAADGRPPHDVGRAGASRAKRGHRRAREGIPTHRAHSRRGEKGPSVPRSHAEIPASAAPPDAQRSMSCTVSGCTCGGGRRLHKPESQADPFVTSGSDQEWWLIKTVMLCGSE